jgi:Flp pilus assembly protein TadG
MTTRRHDRAGQSGASAVEFAVLLPLLIMLVFGIIAFGMAFAQELSLSNAARQGARYGVVETRTCADIEAHVKDAVSTLGLSPGEVTVTVSRGASETALDWTWPSPDSCATPSACTGSDPGDNLYVEARADYQLTIPLVLDGTSNLAGLGAFRCEFS